MNWLLIVVGIIILIGALNGFAKGAIRILVSLVTTVATIVIVFYATPYVSQSIKALTPLDEVIEDLCLQTIENAAAGDTSQTGLSETQVRAILQGAGVSEETLEAAGITVEDIVNGKVSDEALEEAGISSHILDGYAAEDTGIDIFEIDIPRNMQITVIENAEIPEIYKDLLLSNNNDEVYELLGVTTFAEYVGKYLSKIVVDILSFLLTFLIVTIVIRALVFALDFVSELPVLGILNRLSGLVVGSSLSLIIVWFGFVLITLVYATDTGKMLMSMIVENELLLFLYEVNPIMNMMTVLR